MQIPWKMNVNHSEIVISKYAYVMSTAGDVESGQGSDVSVINVFDNIVIHIQGVQGFLYMSICITSFQITKREKRA